MSLLPLAEAHRIDPFARLEQRARRLAQAIEGGSRRRDVRQTRAMIVLLLLERSCPRGVRPRKSWYIPGACARSGAGVIARAWFGFYGVEPPTERTIRKHLADLEELLVLVRAPGDWMPVLHPRREVRPRYPDTMHIIDTDEAAEWWASEGRRLLEDNPRARTNPDVWKRVFGDWRSKAAGFELDLFAALELEGRGAGGGEAPVGIGEVLAPRSAQTRAEGEEVTQEEVAEIAAVLRRADSTPFEVLAALRRAGAEIRGANFNRLALGSRARLRGAAAMFAVAALRGDRIRNRAGWVVRCFDTARQPELVSAVARILRGGARAPT